jgi:transcriptional regulator with XRE-family HTH domain
MPVWYYNSIGGAPMRLKEIRLQKGLSQKKIADELGCSPNVYSRYETGDRQPSIEILIRLSEILGVTVDYIIENCNVASYALTSYETELLFAARSADIRAKEDALMILQNHSVKNK